MACAPPTRNSRVTPASSAAAMTTGSGRGQTAMISRHARDARRHGGHQQGRGQRKPSAGHVAADAGERFDALLDRDAGHDLQIPVLRESAGTRRARCCAPPAGWRARTSGATRAASARISSARHFERRRACRRTSARSESARGRRRARTRSTMAADAAVEGAVGSRVAREERARPALPIVPSVDRSSRNPALQLVSTLPDSGPVRIA